MDVLIWFKFALEKCADTISVKYFHLPFAISFVEVPPSFCEIGNAISSVIGQRLGSVDHGEEYVLLPEEHSLVLTCCWVSLKVSEEAPLTTILVLRPLCAELTQTWAIMLSTPGQLQILLLCLWPLQVRGTLFSMYNHGFACYCVVFAQYLQCKLKDVHHPWHG